MSEKMKALFLFPFQWRGVTDSAVMQLCHWEA